jgi:hypothetical protein
LNESPPPPVIQSSGDFFRLLYIISCPPSGCELLQTHPSADLSGRNRSDDAGAGENPNPK